MLTMIYSEVIIRNVDQDVMIKLWSLKNEDDQDVLIISVGVLLKIMFDYYDMELEDSRCSSCVDQLQFMYS